MTFGSAGVAEAVEAAGLPDDCVLHGLRKTTARIVEELGGKASSLTGHLSPQMEKRGSDTQCEGGRHRLGQGQ